MVVNKSVSLIVYICIILSRMATNSYFVTRYHHSIKKNVFIELVRNFPFFVKYSLWTVQRIFVEKKNRLVNGKNWKKLIFHTLKQLFKIDILFDIYKLA